MTDKSKTPCKGCRDRVIEPKCHTDGQAYKESVQRLHEAQEALKEVYGGRTNYINCKRGRKGKCGLTRKRRGLDGFR